MKRGRRRGRQKKRRDDNIREWSGLEFVKFLRAVENRAEWRKLVVVPTTLAVKGLVKVKIKGANHRAASAN